MADRLNSEKVLDYFKEISKIPRETGKEKEISDFLVNFARERNLEVVQDEVYNVVIKKKSTIENYNGPAVILQGHMDMVYEKDPDSHHKYEDGIEVIERDGYLYGNKTTLGADNGIALAYFLALMDNDGIKHPDLEIVITTQEEAGLVGAQKLDMSGLKGKYLINLDAEEEGVFFTSCAGGIRNYVHIPTNRQAIKGYIPLSITIHGLKGGHSGLEIDQERANAIKLLGRLLYGINDEDIYLLSIEAPGKANAISPISKATLMIKENKREKIISRIRELEKVFQNEFKLTDKISIDIVSEKPAADIYNVYTQECKDNIINILMLMPHGVINKSMAIPGLVQTSINIGSIEEGEDKISILSSIRSSVASQKYNLVDVITIIANTFGGEAEFFNDYPEWEYKPESRLRELVKEVYEENFNRQAKMTAIHAGLECGYFANKLKDVDIISLGPDTFEVHTTKEHVSIESVKNVWLFLVKLLERIGEEG
ncbi:MAG: aminoacyl-histidine dipeptidase [Tissierellia bacterium]|nr:aminoacyl-histidine dipeptidase [Tissierellia bacterium]